MNDLEVEREHTEYENALEQIEVYADDGIRALSADEKTAALNEIRALADEVL